MELQRNKEGLYEETTSVMGCCSGRKPMQLLHGVSSNEPCFDRVVKGFFHGLRRSDLSFDPRICKLQAYYVLTAVGKLEQNAKFGKLHHHQFRNEVKTPDCRRHKFE